MTPSPSGRDGLDGRARFCEMGWQLHRVSAAKGPEINKMEVLKGDAPPLEQSGFGERFVVVAALRCELAFQGIESAQTAARGCTSDGLHLGLRMLRLQGKDFSVCALLTLS